MSIGDKKWVRKKAAAADVDSIDWSEYFASIISVCPWSKSYWKQQKIDIQKWRGTKNIIPLDDYVARVWIHKNASRRLLCKMHHIIAENRPNEEWLYSHPTHNTYGKWTYSTLVPVLLQQDRFNLAKARQSIKKSNQGKTLAKK